MVSHIAETIDRKREYTSRRTSVLESDEYGLVTRVMKDEGTVMLTPTGRTLIAEVKDTHLLPKQRAKIESELDYSVPGE
ncbi:hypothetical protein DVR14_00995 (plasmid) [Natrinema thermotolerans]|nr:hypothetical protein DVR14_00995 [Natrinema thermotolerans]